LTFKNDTETDLHLHVEHLFVRAGKLLIGNETHPFNRTAKITLHGTKAEEAKVFDGTIEGGNKAIVNVGTIKMYGKPQPFKMTRLTAECYKGDKSFKVEPNLAIFPGDRLALAPTSYDFMASDDIVVNTYDNATGVVTFNGSLSHYHYGAAESTGKDFNGVDMRGEVMLLNGKNVIIQGENVDGWGGRFVTMDTIEADLSIRSGITVLHNVEIYNCSQADTERAALEWKGASGGWSHIANVSIHNGKGQGVFMQASANVKVENSVIYNFMKIGFNIVSV